MTELQHPLENLPRQTLSPEFLHELRTPLNQIIGYSDMLAEQAEEEGQARIVPDLQRIHTAGQQLLALLINGAQSPPAAALPQVVKPTAAARSGTPEQLYLDPAEQMAADTAQALILVVDDNEMNRDVLSRRLDRQGYGVVMAADGREAMEAVRAQTFDLVLLDIMMPEMDGYAVLQQLKADEALHHIPVIMISALDEVDSVVRCIEMGAEDYLPKPFNPVLLKARIGACLAKKRAHDREMHLFGECQQNYKRLQELERLREELTSMIVHDLRTPLTSIITGMQTLGAGGELNEIQQELTAMALSGGQTLLGMINTLLDVEKLESGGMKLDYALLSPTDLVADAVGQVAQLAAGKNQTLVQQIAPNLKGFEGDKDMLVRTLVNLLGNAIKFTPSGGILTISASQSAEKCVLSVSDTGDGIPAESLGRIFEKFGQVESRAGGNKMGTGLGLTFCKLVVEAHGGEIKVESVPGKGSTFTLIIPAVSSTPLAVG